jgi:hypothetical protein
MTSKIEMLSWRRREIAQLFVVELLEDDLLMRKTMLCKFISRMKSLGRPQLAQLYGNKSAKSEFAAVKQHLTGSASPDIC